MIIGTQFIRILNHRVLYVYMGHDIIDTTEAHTDAPVCIRTPILEGLKEMRLLVEGVDTRYTLRNPDWWSTTVMRTMRKLTTDTKGHLCVF